METKRDKRFLVLLRNCFVSFIVDWGCLFLKMLLRDSSEEMEAKLLELLVATYDEQAKDINGGKLSFVIPICRYVNFF